MQQTLVETIEMDGKTYEISTWTSFEGVTKYGVYTYGPPSKRCPEGPRGRPEFMLGNHGRYGNGAPAHHFPTLESAKLGLKEAYKRWQEYQRTAPVPKPAPEVLLHRKIVAVLGVEEGYGDHKRARDAIGLDRDQYSKAIRRGVVGSPLLLRALLDAGLTVSLSGDEVCLERAAVAEE